MRAAAVRAVDPEYSAVTESIESYAGGGARLNTTGGRGRPYRSGGFGRHFEIFEAEFNGKD